MSDGTPKLNVCLNNRHRRYRPDSPMQNRRELGVHGTRAEIIDQYANLLELRYAQGDIRPRHLLETFDNIEDCRCPGNPPCTTGALEAFVTAKLELITCPA